MVANKIDAWKSRRVFVTGGNGFLGSYLVQMLVEAGASVFCLIKNEIPQSRFYLEGIADRVIKIQGVVEDFNLLCEVLQKYEIDVVFHLAAQPIVGEAKKNPLSAFESNVRGTYHVLEAARQYGNYGNLSALISCTSDKVYGDANRLPYCEIDRLDGINPYDASKVCADVLSQSYAKTYELPVAIARMGNLYGPGDTQWSRIVPGTIRSLIQGARPVIRGDGNSRRDYFYVEDAADALFTLGAVQMLRRFKGEAFNFGTGTATSTWDLVKKLIQKSERDVQPVVLNEVKGEIKAQYLDCNKAGQMLGWRPCTSLSEGLEKTWLWYKKLFS